MGNWCFSNSHERALCQALREQQLTHLQITAQLQEARPPRTWSSLAIANLARALAANTTVRSVELDVNAFEQEADARALAQYVLSKPTITELQLRGRSLSSLLDDQQHHHQQHHHQQHHQQQQHQHQDSHLPQAACNRARSLSWDSPRRLVLRDNELPPEASVPLARLLGRNNSFTEVDLAGNALACQGIQQIAQALKRNTSIASLNLRDNLIGADGASHLARALQGNSTLTELNLGNNRIQDDGVRALARALSHDTSPGHLSNPDLSSSLRSGSSWARNSACRSSLHTLSVGHNQLGDEGAAHIAALLHDNQVLTRLDLRTNKIKAAGAREIARALKQPSTRLVELDIQQNGIGHEGARYFSEALLVNKSLRILNLHGNSIKDEGTSYIADSLRQNRTLKRLVVWGNQMSKEGALHLASALLTNPMLDSLVWDFDLAKILSAYLPADLQTPHPYYFNMEVIAQNLDEKDSLQALRRLRDELLLLLLLPLTRCDSPAPQERRASESATRETDPSGWSTLSLIGARVDNGDDECEAGAAPTTAAATTTTTTAGTAAAAGACSAFVDALDEYLFDANVLTIVFAFV